MADEKPKKPKRRKAKRGIQFYTDDATANALDRYVNDQSPDVKPTRRGVLETALRQYLQSKGYWPPKSEPK